MAFALVLVSGLSTTACVKKEVVTTGSGSSATGVGPSLVVEQFMRAVNARDIARMGQLFGTKDGPISSRDSRDQVEQRMFALASILHHEDFEIQGEQIVPGRTTEATLLTVKLTKEQRGYQVPFTLVRYKSSSWLVEQVGIDVITAPRN
jgi:hypothetical protein